MNAQQEGQYGETSRLKDALYGGEVYQLIALHCANHPSQESNFFLSANDFSLAKFIIIGKSE